MFLITLLFGNQVTMLDSPIICFLVRLLIVFCEYIRFIFLIPTFHNFLFIPKWKKNPPPNLKYLLVRLIQKMYITTFHPIPTMWYFFICIKPMNCIAPPVFLLSSLPSFSSPLFSCTIACPSGIHILVLTPHKSSVPLMVHPLYSHTLYLSLPSRDKTQNLISQWLGCGFYQSLYLYIPITSFLLISLKNSIYIEILHLSITVIALQIWK